MRKRKARGAKPRKGFKLLLYSPLIPSGFFAIWSDRTPAEGGGVERKQKNAGRSAVLGAGGGGFAPAKPAESQKRSF